jgi:hypothetical protein
MIIKLHFTEMTSQPEPRRAEFYIKLPQVTDPNAKLIGQLGLAQASMKSTSMRTPMAFTGVSYLDADVSVPANVYPAHTWGQLMELADNWKPEPTKVKTD